MAPYRMAHGGKEVGSIVIDRRFRGVGRVKRSSGTHDPKLARQLDAMLTTLWQAGRVDVLQAIKSGHLTLLEVWARYRLGEMDRLPTVELMKPLRAALHTWLRTSRTGEQNRAARKYAVRAILRLAPKDAGLQTLPELLRKYGDGRTGPAMFNGVRAHLLAFLRDTLGKRHKLHDLVADIPPQKEHPRRRPRLTPAEVAELARQMGDYGDEVWALATTGMRTDREYFAGRWEMKGDGIEVRGTKTRAAVRTVPNLGLCVPPRIGYWRFQRLMRAATGGRIKPYDLRGVYGTWLEQCGIPRGRVVAYLGHSNRSVTDLYTRDEAGRHLAEDRDRLRAYLGTPAPPAQGLRLA